MTFITTNTTLDGKVAILISVDNYSDYCFGVAIEKEMSFHQVHKHIASIVDEVNKRHLTIRPVFVMAFGKEMIPELEKQFKGKAGFLFNPTLADKIAMPAAKLLMERLFNNKK